MTNDMEQARIEALRIGTAAAVREWAIKYNIPILPCTDELLLQSIHEARIWEPKMIPLARAVSRRIKKGGNQL